MRTILLLLSLSGCATAWHGVDDQPWHNTDPSQAIAACQKPADFSKGPLLTIVAEQYFAACMRDHGFVETIF